MKFELGFGIFRCPALPPTMLRALSKINGAAFLVTNKLLRVLNNTSITAHGLGGGGWTLSLAGSPLLLNNITAARARSVFHTFFSV